MLSLASFLKYFVTFRISNTVHQCFREISEIIQINFLKVSRKKAKMSNIKRNFLLGWRKARHKKT